MFPQQILKSGFASRSRNDQIVSFCFTDDRLLRAPHSRSLDTHFCSCFVPVVLTNVFIYMRQEDTDSSKIKAVSIIHRHSENAVLCKKRIINVVTIKWL